MCTHGGKPSLGSPSVKNCLQQGFHVGIDKMKQVNGYMQSHVVEIAADNLLGQCTHGHSCKNSTREALEELVRTAKNDTTKGIR